MASKKAARRGFTEGVAWGQTPTDETAGSGSHSPLVRGDKILTQDAHPGEQRPVPRMVRNSKDGVVTRPRGHESQGWYPNSDVRGVEVR